MATAGSQTECDPLDMLIIMIGAECRRCDEFLEMTLESGPGDIAQTVDAVDWPECAAAVGSELDWATRLGLGDETRIPVRLGNVLVTGRRAPSDVVVAMKTADRLRDVDSLFSSLEQADGPHGGVRHSIGVCRVRHTGGKSWTASATHSKSGTPSDRLKLFAKQLVGIFGHASVSERIKDKVEAAVAAWLGTQDATVATVAVGEITGEAPIGSEVVFASCDHSANFFGSAPNLVQTPVSRWIAPLLLEDCAGDRPEKRPQNDLLFIRAGGDASGLCLFSGTGGSTRSGSRDGRLAADVVPVGEGLEEGLARTVNSSVESVASAVFVSVFGISDADITESDLVRLRKKLNIVELSRADAAGSEADECLEELSSDSGGESANEISDRFWSNSCMGKEERVVCQQSSSLPPIRLTRDGNRLYVASAE